jgi:hypothetical protein
LELKINDLLEQEIRNEEKEKMAYELESGVLDDGSELEFDPKADPKADNLEGVVAGSGTQASNSSVSRGDVPSYFMDNLRKLGKRVNPYFDKTGHRISRINTKIDVVGTLNHDLSLNSSLGLALGLVVERWKKDDARGEVCEIKFLSLDTKYIRTFLENVYGDEIKQSGIYADLGLEEDFEIKAEGVREILNYFPEFSEFSIMEGRYVLTFDDPFFSMLNLPIRERIFFTGALEELMGEKPTYNQKYEREFNTRLSFTDIMNYAKKVGEVENLAEYMESYNLMRG